MFRTQAVGVRGALLVGALAWLSACNSDATVVSPRVTNELFLNYVAIGNSITAGFQSDGINDSTQAQSYAVLVAGQMGTRFAIPALAKPGCRPPINNFQTQTRVTLPGQPASTATTCLLRTGASATTVLNNVAVPGITSFDPTLTGGATGYTQNNNPLMELILGGKTMVQKALEARPTFATVWVGNNDVLQPAITGLPSTATPQATFEANYNKMIAELVTGAPGVKGVLIGVVQTSNAPVLFTAAALQIQAFRDGLTAAAGMPLTIDASCSSPTGIQSLIGFPLIAQIRARALPPIIACLKTSTPPIGDIFILDATEQVQAKAIVDGYNTFIKSKADAIGFAYYDPNTTLARLTPLDPVLSTKVPNLASPTATFGAFVSLDGIHPTAAAHIQIAKDLIAVINTKYGTNLATLP
ncbi:MAG TPA: SGNH/GDSL hydrolase family protein [Gemmatimonadaceae bacterium]